MDKLIENAKKELAQIEEKGFNKENLDLTERFLDIIKDAQIVKAMEEGGKDMRYYPDDYRNGYGMREDYGKGPYYDYDGYGRRGVPGSGRGGRYSNHSERIRDHLGRINECAEMYDYGKDRYMHGGDEERMYEGLDKLMRAICMFVESTMEFAESPEEKEIIRKHVQKMKMM